MHEDIAPALLESIRQDFERNLGGRQRAVQLLEKIQAGGANYADAGDYAEEVGAALADAFRANLSSAALPDGRMYWNIADRVVRPLLEQDHTLVAEAAQTVQQSLNTAAGLGIRPQPVPINESRVEGILNKISAAEQYDDVAWVLGEPVKNFSRAIIDESIRRNVEFQGGAGLRPRVIRRVVASCCRWCSNLAGTYTYPDVPNDVYRRHEYCRCTVEYDPGDGRRQNVWSKQWTTASERDKINVRKTVGLDPQQPIDGLHPATLGGAKRGEDMTFEEADSGKVNPMYGTEYGYSTNCQSCVVAFEARQRGYDVITRPNTKGSMLENLSKKTNLAWIDPKTGKHPDYIFENKKFTAKTYTEYLKSVIEPGKRYTVEFTWKGRGYSGHIVNIDRDNKGNLRIKDNQRGPGERSEYIGDVAVQNYFSQVKFETSVYGTKINIPPKVLRVDNMEFDLSVVNKILEVSNS